MSRSGKYHMLSYPKLLLLIYDTFLFFYQIHYNTFSYIFYLILAADTVGWSTEDEIILESTIDAILKFSIFLSTRTYSADFMP